MSSPPVPYTRQFDFTDFSATNPDEQQPGISIDAEYDALKTVMDKLISRLGELQRSDGPLKNLIVTPDSLATSVLALVSGVGTPRGAWLTTTAYAAKDLVVQAGATYISTTAHIAGVFAADLAAGKWIIFNNSTAQITADAIAGAVATLAPGSVQWAAGAGSINAITAAYPTPVVALTDGLILGFRAAGTNTTSTPTFKADGTALHTITKNGGLALLPGDIPANGECLVRYRLAATVWELLNPTTATPNPSQNAQWAVAGGTANAITATFPVPITNLTDGLIVCVRATANITSGAPTFKADGTAAHTITKCGGFGLLVSGPNSEITTNSELVLRYNLANTRWELLNSAFGLGAQTLSLSQVNITNGGAFVFIDNVTFGIYFIFYDWGGNAFYDLVMHAQFIGATVFATLNFGSPGTRTYDSSAGGLRLAIAGSPGDAVGLPVTRIYG